VAPQGKNRREVLQPTSPCSNGLLVSSGVPGRDGTGLSAACEAPLSHTICFCLADLELHQLNT
jgi:hypothetical protein